MKVLIVHNYYQQPGGEDTVVETEIEMLKQFGHEVKLYQRSNHEVSSWGIGGQWKFPKQLVWASDTVRDVNRLTKKWLPDIVHVHNTFFMVSPVIFYSCRALGIPVVQSLHNPRLLCPSANFYRNGETCQDCLGKRIPWPGVLRGCYRQSRVQTAGVATMVSAHRLAGTWAHQVSRYVVFTEFYKKQFITGGLPPKKIRVKPHFVHPDPGTREGPIGEYALFVGRFDPEKGIRSLLKAWEGLQDIPLKLRGSGQLMNEVMTWIKEGNQRNVECLDRLNRQELMNLNKGARFLIWPSEGLYECFGLVAIEAFACGVPVIASNTGVMAEVVNDGETGLLFTPGDANDLRKKVRWAWDHPDVMSEMGKAARRNFESRYSIDRNYEMLMDVYEEARVSLA